jgi:hypothetical protein
LAIKATPNLPEKQKPPFALIDSSVKPATPDLILFEDAEIPEEIITALLFEEIGSIEILNIARSDIINGREISYGLMSKLSDLSRRYAPNNIFKVSGTLSEFFDNFSIKYKLHVPEEGTGPNKIYIGEENSFNCSGFPVLTVLGDEVVDCFTTFAQAQDFLSEQKIEKDLVYSDQATGNIIVDVINLKKDDLVEIELLVDGSLEDDTIY